MDALKPKDPSGIGIKAVVAALPYVKPTGMTRKEFKNWYRERSLQQQAQQIVENTDAKKS